MMEENRLERRSCHESARACMTHLLKYNQLNPPSSHFFPIPSRPPCSVAKSKREKRGKEGDKNGELFLFLSVFAEHFSLVSRQGCQGVCDRASASAKQRSLADVCNAPPSSLLTSAPSLLSYSLSLSFRSLSPVSFPPSIPLLKTEPGRPPSRPVRAAPPCQSLDQSEPVRQVRPVFDWLSAIS